MIYAYDDPNKWGRMIHKAAGQFGEGITLFRNSSEVPDTENTTAFIHMLHLPLDERSHTKCVVEELSHKTNVTLIPRIHGCRLYDDKVAQFKFFGQWMPSTTFFDDRGKALCAINHLNYPVVSKSKEGAGASNVRMIKDKDDATLEVCSVFSPNGLKLYAGNFQKDYILWQSFIPGLLYNWRVFIFAKKYAIITKRWNEDKGWSVNDRGKIEQIEELDTKLEQLLNFTVNFVETNDFIWSAVDVIDDNSSLYVLETSVGFPFWWFQKGGLIFKLENGNWSPSGYKASELWTLLVKSIIRGDFSE